MSSFCSFFGRELLENQQKTTNAEKHDVTFSVRKSTRVLETFHEQLYDPRHPVAREKIALVPRVRLPRSEHRLPTRTRTSYSHSAFSRQNSIHISSEADRQTHSDWLACGLHYLCGPFGLLGISEQLKN